MIFSQRENYARQTLKDQHVAPVFLYIETGFCLTLNEYDEGNADVYESYAKLKAENHTKDRRGI